MDNIASATAAPKDTGFLKHIFDDNYKSEMLNLLQYGLIAVIPMTIIIRNVNFFSQHLIQKKVV